MNRLVLAKVLTSPLRQGGAKQWTSSKFLFISKFDKNRTGNKKGLFFRGSL